MLNVKRTKMMLVSCAVFFACCQGRGIAAQKHDYKTQSRRDPFMPLISPSGYLINFEMEKEAAVQLEGILYDAGGDSMALINGELLSVGDAIGEAVLSKIEENKVTIIKNNKEIDIELRREE